MCIRTVLILADSVESLRVKLTIDSTQVLVEFRGSRLGNVLKLDTQKLEGALDFMGREKTEFMFTEALLVAELFIELNCEVWG